MPPKTGKGKGKAKNTKGNGHALSLDLSLGNLSPTPSTARSQSPMASDKPDTDIKAASQKIFDTASYSQIGDTLVYGNSLGHNVLEKQEEHRRQFKAMDSKIDSQDRRLADLEAQLKVVKRRIPTNTTTISRHLPTGHFAIIDASLYETGVRHDASLLIEIYGLNASQILKLSQKGDYDSIAIINARATLKSDKEKMVPEDIEEAWQDYVSKLEVYWGQIPREDLLSPLTQAYYKFWKVCGT
ncbi:MAG: hypothetical protein M1840_008673 [Geoglossum simile]|nr:MAG: hypothetical protein M1840_008673 [Geoglossum simile]